jgi:transcription elongation factor GreB
MSRAFVKDDDGGPEPTIYRPVSSAPNYVTPRGRRLLRDALKRAEKAGNDREERYYRERLDTAIVVERPPSPAETVEFGATVTAHDANGVALRVRIVGEDEADPLRGAISWESPVAQAFTDHRVGERVIVQRPAGPIEYTIDAISFED